MTAEQLISIAVPMLERIERAWIVGRDDKKVARAARAALQGENARKIAELIVPYFLHAEGPETEAPETSSAPVASTHEYVIDGRCLRVIVQEVAMPAAPTAASLAVSPATPTRCTVCGFPPDECVCPPPRPTPGSATPNGGDVP